MATPSDVIQRKDELLSALEQDTDAGLRDLHAFVRDYGSNKKLKARTVMLLGDAQQARRVGSDQSFRDEAMAIFGEVDKELAEKGAETLAERYEQLERTRKTLAGRKIDARVVVEAQNLGKSFNEFRLHGIDLKLCLGRITGVVGENANGKTTLFRMLVGELKNSEGSLSYPELGSPDPNRVNWGEVRNRIAYVPQTLEPWHGSLEENLRFAAASHGILGAENDEEFHYITERLGLREYLGRSWHENSGGYRLRFELARALIWHPQMLVLDEPLANLDFKAQETLLRDVQALARSYTSPIAVVISSQHLHEVEAVADDILFLRRGEVIYNGPQSEIGESREKNSFEINCDASVAQIKAATDGFPIQRVYSNGLSIVIETGLDLDASELLAQLVKAGIKLTYFRDLSKSVKQLFEQTAMGS